MTQREYLILTTQDSAVLGKFDFAALQEQLNAAGRDGWRIASSLSAGSTMKSNHETVVVFLERDLP
jgi:hypothetical protein